MNPCNADHRIIGTAHNTTVTERHAIIRYSCVNKGCAKISVLGRMSEIFLLTFVLLSASRSTLPCNVGKGKSAGNPQTMGKPNFCFRLQASFGLSSHKGSCRSIQTLLRIYHISFSFSNLFSSSSTSYRQWTRSLFALTSIPSCSAHCQGMLFRLSL